MDADSDTLATALYARADDLLKACPERVPQRPETGIFPRISDAGMVTLAVMQALLGFVFEARWLRFARNSMGDLFPYLPGPVRLQQAVAQACRHYVLADPHTGLRDEPVA
jgi:hypothetical protein